MASIRALYVLQMSLFFAYAMADCDHNLPDGTPCPLEGQDFYPDMEHCSKYWECLEGCAFHRTCPNSYLYELHHKWCTYPEEVSFKVFDCLKIT